MPAGCWLLAVVWLCAAWPAAARCVDEDVAEAAATAPGTPPPAPVDPRATLSALVRDALQRSHAVGAAQLLAKADLQDIVEARSAQTIQAIQASVGGGFGPGGARSAGITETSAMQLRASINVSPLLYDGGRTDRLTDWRTQLAESARHGQLSQQQQRALTAEALFIERSRYRMTAQVYRKHVRKMGCLVEALDTITRTDRGRASELVQAKKSMQQAELSLTQTQSAVRQVEVRLRRLVGDGLPGTEGLSSVFIGVPDLPQRVADAERSSEIAQLESQAAAAKRCAEAVESGGKPQVSQCGVARYAAFQKTDGFDFVARRKPQQCQAALRGFATTPRGQRRGFMCRVACNTTLDRQRQHRGRCWRQREPHPQRLVLGRLDGQRAAAEPGAGRGI